MEPRIPKSTREDQTLASSAAIPRSPPALAATTPMAEEKEKTVADLTDLVSPSPAPTAEEKKTTVADLTDLVLQDVLVSPSPAPTVADLTDLALQDFLVSPSPAPAEEEKKKTVADLTDLFLERVLTRLSAADFLRAALACQSFGRAAVRALPRVAPLRGFFYHNAGGPGFQYPADFYTIGASCTSGARQLPAFSLAKTIRRFPRPFDYNTFGHFVEDVNLGLVLLTSSSRTISSSSTTIQISTRIFVVDPASRRMVGFYPPSVSGDFIGAAILKREHPSKLTFDLVCVLAETTSVSVRPRAWVGSVLDGSWVSDSWRPFARTEGFYLDFDLSWMERRCVHAAGNIYWHIADSNRVIELNPSTTRFSYVIVPDALGDGMFGMTKFRIGETPGDGRLCVGAIADNESLQIWVREEGEPTRWSDQGWLLETEILLNSQFDALRLPKDSFRRMKSVSIKDMGFSRIGKVLIHAPVCYLLHLDTGELQGELQRCADIFPIYCYTLPWPPEFLAAPANDDQ